MTLLLYSLLNAAEIGAAEAEKHTTSSDLSVFDNKSVDTAAVWECSSCTYRNTNEADRMCELCFEPRLRTKKRATLPATTSSSLGEQEESFVLDILLLHVYTSFHALLLLHGGTSNGGKNI